VRPSSSNFREIPNTSSRCGYASAGRVAVQSLKFQLFLPAIVSLKRQKNRCPRFRDSESVIRLRFRGPSARLICHRAVHLAGWRGPSTLDLIYRGRISRTFIYLRQKYLNTYLGCLFLRFLKHTHDTVENNYLCETSLRHLSAMSIIFRTSSAVCDSGMVLCCDDIISVLIL